MIKVKDGYAKLIGTTVSGSASRVLLSNGSDFGLHTGRNNEADKIVRTDASGYIQAGLINTTSSNMETTAINRIYCSNDSYIRYKTPADFFSTLANDSNQLSITVGSQNRKLTVAYATNSDTVGGYHANELFTDLSNSGNNLSVTIGETTKKLTVDYASNASSATKLTSSAGSAILPIYFSNGKPVACSFQHYYIFNNNNIPYIKLFTLKITQAYINTPITFNIKGRSGREAFIAIKFSNGGTTDPTITYFKGWGGYSGYYTRLRIYKTDASTWEVWKMSQAEGYDLGYVWDMQVPEGITFKWNNATSSAEPTYTTYTNCTIETLSANISGNADTLDGYHASSFSLTSHTHSYLPLTGGTLTGSLTVGDKDANEIISIAGNTSHLKMIAHTNATYIQSGNKDWNGNTPLLITGYSGSKGSDLYLYFNNIYCRSNGNSYVNLDSGNWSNYITLPTIPSISVSNSGSGNAVTSITASGHTLTVNKGSTFSLSGHAHSVLTFQAGIFSNKTYNGTSTQTINVPTTGAHIGLGNVQNTAFYKRSTTVNGALWDMAGTVNSEAFTIYAPETAGTSGQILVSNGSGAPSWKTLSLKDTDISWGTTSLQGKLSIMEMAYSNVHSSNKLAFGKVEGITLEYSQNGGSSWVELTEDTWNQKKLNLISGISSSVSTGNRTKGNTANDRLRITLNAVAMGIYTRPSKLLININTNVTTEPYATVKVEYSTIGNPTSYTVYGTYNISGWSGWNSIPLTSLSTFGGASNQTSNVQNIRLTFANNNANKYLTIQDIYMIGQTNWSNPSNMSKTGHLYGYNYNQDMILPASLSLGGVDNFNKKISYLGPEGHLYITANNINSSKTGGIVIKTTKNSIVSQVLLQSDTNTGYGKVTITGDLCIGGRKSNTTAFISSDAEHNMYISVQGKTLLVCNSSENSIRCGYNCADTINLGTTSYPWKAVYSKSLCLKDYGYESTIKPNSKITSNLSYTLPSVGGTLLVDTQGVLVKGWVKLDFSYDSTNSNYEERTYSISIEQGNGSSIFDMADGKIYYPYFSEVGMLLYLRSLTNTMHWSFTSNGTVVLQANYSYGTAGNKGLRIYCKDSAGNILKSGSGTLFFIKFN